MFFRPLSQLLADPLCQNIRLIATDMDGTLTQQGKFSASLLESLENLAQAGISVLIITGRSAGWMSGLSGLMPVVGAIAENGGLFYPADQESPVGLTVISDFVAHRQHLASTFAALKLRVPKIQESVDNQFRITDWTFDVQGLNADELELLEDLCQQNGWGFTYSSVQCHIKPATQDKATGLLKVLRDYFPDYSPEQVLTVGDSPNDQTLFNPNLFPMSVGVANVLEYANELTYQPAYITHAAEGAGFCELARSLLNHCSFISGPE